MTEFDINLEDFKELKASYCSTKDGVILRGLKDFFKVICEQGEENVRKWLKKLGYDEHLFNPESRNFNITFHGTK
jgi:hypothetical protein